MGTFIWMILLLSLSTYAIAGFSVIFLQKSAQAGANTNHDNAKRKRLN
jgi:hypothetical protein